MDPRLLTAVLLDRNFVSNKDNCIKADVDFNHACFSNDCSLHNDGVVAFTLSVASHVCVSIRWLTQEKPLKFSFKLKETLLRSIFRGRLKLRVSKSF